MNTYNRLIELLLLSAFLLACGCAAEEMAKPVTVHPTNAAAAVVPASAAQPSPQGSSSSSPSSSSPASPSSNTKVLEQLWQSRIADVSATDSSSEFPLGPGDVLQISIPQIPQLGNRLERVSENNTISLPLLGQINVSGMTQEDLLHTLAQRTAKYVRHPQVDVFLQHTEGRQVAVIGAVRNPGRYSLASRSDTIMTMVGRAGGMTETAGSRIILLPASSAPDFNLAAAASQGEDSLAAPRRASYTPGQAVQTPGGRGPSVPANGQASAAMGFAQALQRRVVISTTSAQDQRYLELPARPGDVVLIPAAGQVTVQGWVDKPGAFMISPGMTVLSSIAAAGGAVFTNSATLLRQQDDGRKMDVRFNLAKVKRGEQPDMQVQSGDVVVVERSPVGAIPYTLYFLVQKVGIGVAATPLF
jgi:protein involved in polysaccharide export with SLBB domain